MNNDEISKASSTVLQNVYTLCKNLNKVKSLNRRESIAFEIVGILSLASELVTQVALNTDIKKVDEMLQLFEDQVLQFNKMYNVPVESEKVLTEDATYFVLPKRNIKYDS